MSLVMAGDFGWPDAVFLMSVVIMPCLAGCFMFWCMAKYKGDE